ncbi:hypothetical protein ACFX13_015410 [Malus domestica]|uniref:SAM domain-containing protein n=1 Tax=Malus baccata TaxID=106549 RepID=A0A540NPD4_MALBA|nr:uncharacterized protein LOC103454956 [Malus domestica]XP_050121594.1 uncharacterized protein LOC126599282 [Malus sylvestris]TQE12891.1 hypothetical protein C1H46_001537 [Malus baccata]
MAEIQPQPVPQINGGGQFLMGSSETVGSKRQRRPSVRLGDIGGDQPYDSQVRRATKQWRLPPDHRKDANKSSKPRPLTNLSSVGEFHETLDGEDREANLDSVAIGSWKVKDAKKRASSVTKRVRSNWVSSKIDEGGGEGDEKFSGAEDVDDGYHRDFDVENSESPLKERSPIHSSENLGVDGHANGRELLYHGSRRPIRTRISEGRDNHDGIELSGPSDNDARDWNCRGTSGVRIGNEGRGRCGEDGVRVWLNGLGLGRYAPVFEIHEVDDEVLPMLTLEDLKDMGVNAVGSRRKMYCAIQKLGKGFS